MKAAVFFEHGGREVLKVIDDLPQPEPKPGEALVHMKAVALNRLDLWVREGWKGLDLPKPHVTCADGAGEVAAIGAGVTAFAPGDRVGINPTLVDPDCLLTTGNESDCLNSPIFGEHAPGVAAEFVALPVRNLIKLPDHVPYEDSAAAGLVYITAWYSLVTKGGIRPGESVLIIGAGGGANTAYLQIARLSGASVIVVGSSAERCARAQALGADITIDRSADPNWSKAVYSLTGRRGVDIVVDNVGKVTLNDSLRAVKRGGRVLMVGNTSGYDAQIDTRLIFGKQISIIGTSMGPSSDFRRVMSKVFDGSLKPVIGATLPLEQIAEGHRLLEAGEVFGKVVLTL
ncbi:MAG: zinc-binding dehydrogenase [Anaerolineae bacterium]|nr:zinc-binding dehydrogenase [Anaerolineae bacterium]NUQ06500.1 zinc-binding dehydrogenase [Anaerolineae bacterium]